MRMFALLAASAASEVRRRIPQRLGQATSSEVRHMIRNATTYAFPSGFCDSMLPPSRVDEGVWSWNPRRQERLRRVASSFCNGVDDQDARLVSSLRGKSVVFMGDSNTRYQYLSLAYFLQHRRWPVTTTGRGFSIVDEASVFSEPAFSDPGSSMYQGNHTGMRAYSGPWMTWKWHAFQNMSTRSLDGREVCECQMNGMSGVENRFFQTGRASSGRAIRASFAWLGRAANWKIDNKAVHHSRVGRWATRWIDLKEQVAEVCQDGRCRSTKAYHEEDALTFVNTSLRALAPDIVIFGPGGWIKMNEADREALREFMLAVKHLVGPSGRAIFKTCPRGARRDRHGCANTDVCGDHPIRGLASETGWEIFDFFRLTDELFEVASRSDTKGLRTYRDMFHVTDEAYRELNRWLFAKPARKCRSSV